jgi:hypothetical protein
MKGKLVKFDDDGTKCKNDINYLRRHPECGIFFIQDKPFRPVNPNNKFKPIDRNFTIDNLDREVPSDPNIPDAPSFGQPQKIGGAVGSPPYTNKLLPQDYSNYQQGARRLVAEVTEQEGGYSRLPSNDEAEFTIPRIGNSTYSHQNPRRPTPRPVGEVELQDFGAGTGNNFQEVEPINRSGLQSIDDIRFTNVDLEEEITTAPVEQQTRNSRIEEIVEQIDASLTTSQRATIRRGRSLMPDPRELDEFPDAGPVRPRGSTEEELIDTQIEQLTRNSTREDARQIEASLREGASRGRANARPIEEEGTELFPITPDSEELVFLREVDRILPVGETELTVNQAATITRELQSRGISQERIESLLLMYEAYDPALASAVAGSSRPRQEEALMRRLKMGIRGIPRPDSNLLPQTQQSIELRPDTPLTRGRTDIARGRSRLEKFYDRAAGRLPEDVRTMAARAKTSVQAFNETIRTRSSDALQQLSASRTRMFGQSYAGIRETATELRGGSIELQQVPEGNINIRPPATEDVTGIRQGDLQAIDFDPLGAEYGESFIPATRPKLTYAQRLNRARLGAVSREAGVGSVGATGGILIGFGVAQLMGKAGVTNNYEIAAAAGAAGGAGARILTMAGSRALTRGAETAAVDAVTYSAIRGGTSILRGAAEGAFVGLALMPVDKMLNDNFVNHGKTHVYANLASGGIVGGTAAALTTIGLVAAGAAPETLGASLVVGGIALGVTSAIGYFTGRDQDKKEEEIRKAKKARDEMNSTNAARQKLLETLPDYDYNFDKALNAYADKDSLGIDNNTWDTFSSNTGSMFVAKPNNKPPPTPTSGDAPTGEQKKINDLFNQYITHELIGRVCTDDGGCEELKTHDQGELTPSEVKFLNDKTGSIWQGQADMQVEMSVQALQYTRQRIGAAQLEMLTAWNDQRRIENQLDPYVVETAYLDPTFKQRYDLAVKLDAEQDVVDAYQINQTRFEELPKNIRDMANMDPDFDNMIHQYYKSMETTAGQLSVSVPQLIELQKLEGEAQKDKYQEFQFDDIKQDAVVVAQAQEIAKEEDQVREAGFYDIDQAFLETDPTAISTWHPSDSQILQAHSAGMNLQEYVEYMHQLAMGEAGDYTKLPKYTDEQLRASGLLDYSHFQDELQMANYRKDLYLYNPETRQFTLNPNVTNSAIPSTQQTFISRYTPRYLLQARQEYADMVHGLNEKNQNEVDNFNNNLMRELSSYGKHYDSIVSEINDERLYEGRSDLLFYDVGNIYNQNRIEFSALSDKLSDAPSVNVINQDEATGRQLGQQVSIKENYTLSDTQYRDVKLNLQSKNIMNPTQEQVKSSVQEVKSSPADAPTKAPMAS